MKFIKIFRIYCTIRYNSYIYRAIFNQSLDIQQIKSNTRDQLNMMDF